MDPKPIPAFYCCYLLRSTVRRASLYVGSTPNPKRRLAQHNGDSKGGAVRTSKVTLWPWEMTCMVTGFPSNIAALQFEWAWQNTHLTRRIADAQRITPRETKSKTSSKTGRTRRRPARPKMSLRDKLMNLSLLLRVPSFSRLPLEVRFFCADVYQVWLRWSNVGNEFGASSPRVILDIEQPSLPESDTLQAEPSSELPEDTGVLGGVEGLDVTYVPIREHVRKSISLLDEGESTRCFLCSKEMDSKSTMVLTCPQEQCRSISHLSCLSQSFLSQKSNKSFVPDVGRCPSCRTELKWFALVKELTVRMRAEAIVTKLLRKPRVRKAAGTKAQKDSIRAHKSNEEPEAFEFLEADEDDLVSDSEDHEINAQDVVDEPFLHEAIDLLDEEEFNDDTKPSGVSRLESPARVLFRPPPSWA